MKNISLKKHITTDEEKINRLIELVDVDIHLCDNCELYYSARYDYWRCDGCGKGICKDCFKEIEEEIENGFQGEILCYDCYEYKKSNK